MNSLKFLESFNSLEQIFLLSATFGMFLLLLQGILAFFGLGTEEHFDESSFKWLSKQALIGFFLLFGWTGLTSMRQFHLSSPVSLVISVLAGLFAILSFGCVLKILKKLKSPGTTFKIEETLGKIGTVYQQLSQENLGKITLVLEGISYEIEARSLGEEIPSFTQVKVVKIEHPNCVIVTKVTYGNSLS